MSRVAEKSLYRESLRVRENVVQERLQNDTESSSQSCYSRAISRGECRQVVKAFSLAASAPEDVPSLPGAKSSLRKTNFQPLSTAILRKEKSRVSVLLTT